MTRPTCLYTIAIILAGFGRTTMAQDSVAEKAAPAVTVMLKSGDEVLTQFDHLLKLTNKKEQKQQQVLEEWFDILLIGIDRSKPIRIDLLMGGQSTRYLSSLPYDNLKTFLEENWDAWGFQHRKFRGKKLYKLDTKADFTGYLRDKYGYAIISERKSEVPQNIADPRVAIAGLLKSGYGIALEGRNNEIGNAELRLRKDSFQQTRREMLSVLKKQKKETALDFALRKMLFNHQLDETERLYVEAAHLLLGWKLDVSKSPTVGRLEMSLQPIEGTSLDQSLQALAKEPSRFANIQRSKNTIFSGRLHLPLDPMRTENLLESTGLLRKKSKNDVAAQTGINDRQKNVRNEIITQLFDMFDETVQQGTLDGFIEAHANPSGKNTLVCGFRTVDGHRIVDVLKLFPKVSNDQEIKIDADKQGNVRIHKAVLSTKRHANFNRFFGGKNLYVGSADEAVWFAAGENALAELKAAIKKTAMPAPAHANPRFADLYVKVGPWMELRNRRAGTKGSPNLRRLALAAFAPGDDVFEIWLERQGKNQVQGMMSLHPGLLRFVGKVIADFSAKNLQ